VAPPVLSQRAPLTQGGEHKPEIKNGKGRCKDNKEGTGNND